MKVSLSWLQDYVHIDMEIGKLADMLTMAGLEVEAVEDRYTYLDTVVVGHITAVQVHPNAQKLTLCTVEAGGESYQVVCGAPNAAVGLRAPLALPGSVLPRDLEIGTSTIRGQHSHGMLCSEGELGLGSDRSGLMVLDAGLTCGQPLNKALNLRDFVLEIGLTPNRSDCLSMIGVAREIAGFNGNDVHRPVVEPQASGGDIGSVSSVTIEAPDHCPRYAARLVEQIRVQPSPFWLQDRLMSVGLRPINNLVDITNFVMMETGQPLHAFDFDNLEENRIVVRTAFEGERFTTLDGKERHLETDMLMICDGRKPVAVGGVMGGLNSEIEEHTRRVLIESAYFNPISVRRTAKRLGLSTDASHRFERGVDPHGTLFALNRAAQLMAELGNGKLVGGTLDVHYDLPKPPCLDLKVPDTNRLLGTRLTLPQMQTMLEAIAFETVAKDDQTLEVRTPSFRVDISRPQDLMEEIARRFGYDHIPVTFPQIPSTPLSTEKLVLKRRVIRALLGGMGFSEAITYSFVHKDSPERLRLAAADKRRNQVEILNPLTEDQAVMRTSLMPGLLQTVQRNLAHQSKTLKLFETGKTFIAVGGETQPEEIEMLAGLWTGDRREPGWFAKPEACDFYDLKGSLEALLAALKTPPPRFTRPAGGRTPYLRSGAAAQVTLNGEEIGVIGEIHPRVCQAYDIKQPVFMFDIDLERLVVHIPDAVTSAPLPKYPSVTRDATLIVAKNIEATDLVDAIWEAEQALVEAVHLFDLFEGSPIPEDRKSLSVRITYRSSERTLEDEIVNQVHQSITEGLIKRFKADLPG